MGIEFEKYLAAVVQAAPVFLKRGATMEKACRLIHQAEKNGARVIAGPVYEQETILYAEIDPRAIIKEKWKIDTVGHYSRPDVVRLVVGAEKERRQT